MTMRRYDLNLLPILDALLRHRNVTRAGHEVGLSQSATSHALGRLRDQFSDRLLVPQGNELQLTHTADALVQPLAEAMALLERLLREDDFEPARALRRFKVGTSDYIAHLLVPAVVAAVGEVAPGVTIQASWEQDNTAAKLRGGELDIAVMPAGSIDGEDLHTQTLYSDELVLISAADNVDCADSTIALSTFLRLPYAAFRRENSRDPSFAELQLARHGLVPRESVRVSDFLVLVAVVARTRCVSLVPRRVVERSGHAETLKVHDAPFPAERLLIQAFWSHALHRDAGHRWFRQLLIDTVSAGRDGATAAAPTPAAVQASPPSVAPRA